MKPIAFKNSNTVYAKDQPEYLDLPALRMENGQVTSLWSLSWIERIRILLSGRMFFTVWTFNNPLQPQRPHLDLSEVVKIPEPVEGWKLPDGELEVRFKYSTGEERIYNVQRSAVIALEEGSSLRIETSHPKHREECRISVQEALNL